MSKEEQILHYIKINPFASQQELAEKVGLSRPTVANYIRNLTKTGKIVGRAYILQEETSIVCIGGANTDRKARSLQQVKLYASNPVETTEVCGGVARNVAENMSRLGYHASLMTAVGDDREGEWLLAQTKSQGVDVSQVWVMQSERTGTYTTLLDDQGETIVAMADMAIYEEMTVQMIEEKWSYIVSAQAVFIDANLRKDCLMYIVNRCQAENIALYIAPISVAKAKKLPNDLANVHLLLLNEAEAETLSSVKIQSIDDCQHACEVLQARGVKQIIIIRKDHSIYYFSTEQTGSLQPYETEIIDVTGASDAFAACTIYGLMNNQSLRDACQLGLAGAMLTVQTEDSVSSLLTEEKIHHIVDNR